MTPAAKKMIAALEFCPCCKAPLEKQRDMVPGGRELELVFLCGSAAKVDAKGYATVGVGCPYPMDQALYLIQKNLPAEVQS